MSTLTPEALSSKIVSLASQPRSVLFAGAGISARVGIPAWGSLLEGLSAVCLEYGDAASAALIKSKVQDGDFLSAAAIYNLCGKIPKGERYKRLVTLLSPPKWDEKLDLLASLIDLGFGAAVTTNFDRVLPGAYARQTRKFPRCLEIDDDTLKAGPMLGEYFIARIHGRLEKPESLVFDSYGYEKITEHPHYLDFLLALFTQRPCCFLGFSFYDPAIAHILDIYSKKHGPNFPQLHLAVIPSSASADLGRKLHDVNIEVVYYDPANGHHDLWHAIRLASQKKSLSAGSAKPSDASISANLPRFKRYTAFSYAQLATRSSQAPLIETSKGAIALSLIEDGGSKGKADDEYIKDVASLLHVGTETAKEFFVGAVAPLVANGYVERKHGKLILLKKEDTLLEKRLDQLSDALIDRAKVLTGVQIGNKDKAGIVRVIEKVFLARAWDLAAYYAGAKIGYPADVNQTLEAILADEKGQGSVSAVGALRIALSDLLQRPSDEEAKILAELGRAAFAVQIIFSSPRQINHARFLIPSKIYFDSNFVMPAIVPGHPMHGLYSKVIARLVDAAKKSKTPLELIVAFQFANEIVAHRKLAVDTVARLGLEDPKRMRQHIASIGAHNGNVFVSAFASEIGRAERRVQFSEFIQRVAPYRTEPELKNYLEGKDFKVVIQDPKKFTNFEKTKTLLEIGYRRGDLGIWGTKKSVLVAHEAVQMAALMTELNQGAHSLFVTADLRLANVIYTDSYLKKMSGAIMSGMGLIGLVDLLLGIRVDGQSFSRLIWGAPVTSDEVRLRDYLLQRALSKYDSAMAKKMPEIITQSVNAAKIEVERRGIDLNETSNISDLAKVHDVLDRMENQFFQKMRETMEEEERKRRRE